MDDGFLLVIIFGLPVNSHDFHTSVRDNTYLLHKYSIKSSVRS